MDNTGEKANHKVKMHKILYAIGIAGVVLINMVSWKSVGFSDWYIRNIFPVWLNTYARLTSIVPFSIGEIMLILAVVITLFGIGFWSVDLICGRKYKKAVRGFGRFYAWTVLAVCYVMTLNCFILYHSSSFSEKYMADRPGADRMVVSLSGRSMTLVHMEDAGSGERTYTKRELAVLRDYIVNKCNELERVIPHDDSGAAYYDGDLVEASRQAMMKLGEEYGQLSGFYVTPKYLTFSEFFSQQYIMGYYKNIYMSHVRISDGVAEDNIFLTKESWQAVEKAAVVKTSTVKKVSDTLMDQTLKLNGVEEGILQYNNVVGLLLDYYDGALY